MQFISASSAVKCLHFVWMKLITMSEIKPHEIIAAMIIFSFFFYIFLNKTSYVIHIIRYDENIEHKEKHRRTEIYTTILICMKMS